MVWSPFEKIIAFLSRNVLGGFCVREKVFNIFILKRENPRDITPLVLKVGVFREQC